MPMAANRVGGDRLVGLAVQRPQFGRAAGAADTALAVNDDVAMNRSSRPAPAVPAVNRRGRVTAWIGDDVGVAYLVGKKLGHPVRGVADSLRPRMRDAIPFFVNFDAGKTKVGAEVDHPRAVRAPAREPFRPTHREANNTSRHHIDRPTTPVQRFQRQADTAGQRRMHLGDRLAVIRSAGRRHELCPRVTGQNSRDFQGGVAGRSDNSYFDGHDYLRIRVRIDRSLHVRRWFARTCPESIACRNHVA